MEKTDECAAGHEHTALPHKATADRGPCGKTGTRVADPQLWPLAHATKRMRTPPARNLQHIASQSAAPSRFA